MHLSDVTFASCFMYFPFYRVIVWIPCEWRYFRSMAENLSRPRRAATSLSGESAWEDLEASGFTKTEKLRGEIPKPHMVGFLFDSEAECLEVVKGLHGGDYILHEAIADTERLYRWNTGHRSQFEVDRRKDRKSALRVRLHEPPKVSAVDAYQELLGMDVKLQARVSKAQYRLQVKFPGSSKSDLEAVAREHWLSVLVGYLQEAELPLVRVAQATSNPIEIMRRAFGTRRMKTLRNRARAWARVRDWMLSVVGAPFPRDAADMLEYLLFLVQEEAPKGRVMDSAAALAVLEDAGQVAKDMRISCTGAWVQGMKSRIAELEQNRTMVKRAPPLTVAMLISLEISVISVDLPDYYRAMSWVVLLCTWGCLRLSDLEGLDPGRMALGSRGLRGVLLKTKTTGPGKQVKETPVFVSRKISISGHDWLRCGFNLWQDFGHTSRDYFVMTTDDKMETAIPKYAPVEKVALYVRQVFLGLKSPAKPRFQLWKHRDDMEMLDQVGMLYWTGHSMRHFLPTVAAAINIGKEERDYIGRWHVNLHQSADYIHTSRQIVHRVQEEVNRALIEGKPAHYDESELIEDYSCYLLTKGRMPRDWVAQHQVWRRQDDKLVLGGQWPTMSADVIDAEIWGEHAFQANPDEGQDERDGEGAEDNTSSPFFVTISRHSGFRRLHKAGCCSTQPWTCFKVEYISKVTEGVADAVCKTCQRANGGTLEEVETSSSGSSSSTDMGDVLDEEGNEPLG